MATIQQTLDVIDRATPPTEYPRSEDFIHAGDPEVELTGIVTTFLATYEVIRKAIALGANLIVTHEPTFYSDVDPGSWLTDDPVYAAKRALIEDNGIVVSRYHSGSHVQVPDAIVAGMLQDLGWLDPEGPPTEFGVWLGPVPTTTVRDLVEVLRVNLDCAAPWVVGDLDLVVNTAGVSVGANSEQAQIGLFRDADVTIVGELHEWATSEYARDAVAQGQRKALIVAGHATSEEPGMRVIAEWLPTLGIEVPVTHVPSGDLFRSGGKRHER